MKFFLQVMLLCLSTAVVAQTQVSGTVTDGNGQPVPGASVVLDSNTGTVTDFDGNFSLNTSKTPPFTLTVSNVGLETKTVTVTSSMQSLSITLGESATQLDEIVVSASRTPERIFESPVAVEKVGIAQIGNTASESFYASLQNLKGVKVNTNSLTFNSLSTRGFATFGDNRFLQLVDGMDNAAPALNFSVGNLVGLNELDVHSIELLPGASSALYGANAFNGVLVMNSKSPFDYEGVSSYYRSGITSQDAAGENRYYDFGVRVAKKFSNKFAAKLNLSLKGGTDWWASDFSDQNGAEGDRSAQLDGSNPGYDGYFSFGDEVSTTLGRLGSAAGVDVAAFGLDPATEISRTGYLESDLHDYNAESAKLDWSLNYRPFENDFEIIYNGRIASGTTIYTANDRIPVKGLKMAQHKIEIKNDNFFLRGYVVSDDSGEAFQAGLTAKIMNEKWKPSLSSNLDGTGWFEEYGGAFLQAVQTGSTVQQSHAAARQYADRNRPAPGSSEFNTLLDSVRLNGDVLDANGNLNGSRFVDASKFYHINGNYNLSHLIDDIAVVNVGGSYRQYNMDSQGTLYTDQAGMSPIKYSEYGAYAQIQKSFIDNRLKLTSSIRYDKNELFEGSYTPRVALGLTLGEKRNHNIRASYQTGYANPTSQSLYIGLVTPQGTLVGAAPDNLTRFNRQVQLSAAGTQLIGQQALPMTGQMAYNNAYSLSSATAAATSFATNGDPSAAAALLTSQVTSLRSPEEVSSFEIGYRAKLGIFSIDLTYFNSTYSNLTSTTQVAAPLYGNVNGTAQEQQLAAGALINGDFVGFNLYTNIQEEITSQGLVAGIETTVNNINLGYNYQWMTYDEFDDPNNAFEASFNTPENYHKFSVGANKFFTDGLSLQMDYRISDGYYWESNFADGQVPSFNVLDAAFKYEVPRWSSTFKLGGSNILGDDYMVAISSSLIGSIYYLNWTVNL